MRIFKTGINKLVVVIILVSNNIWAEVNYINPAIANMSTVTSSDYTFAKKENLSFTNDGTYIIYSENIHNSINKYLSFKTVSTSSELSSEYITDINTLEEKWIEKQKYLKSLSIEEKIKSALTAYATAALDSALGSVIDRELDMCSLSINALNATISLDTTKELIMKAMEMSKEDYDTYQKSAIFVLELLTKDKSFCKTTSLDSSKISEISKLGANVALSSLKIYQGILDIASLGNTLGSMYRLAITQDKLDENLLSLAFIHDYSLKYKGNIIALIASIPKVFYVNKSSQIVFESPYLNAQGYKVPISDFLDVFYWYTLKNTTKLTDIHIGNSNFGDLDLIITSARSTLKYIQNYGNGGNFTLLSRDSLSKDLRKYFTYSSIMKNRNKELSRLYYMNQKQNADFQSFFWISYINVYIPGGLSKQNNAIPDFDKSIVKLNLNIIRINQYLKTIVLDSNDAYTTKYRHINHSIKPNIEILYKNPYDVEIETQSINYSMAVFIPSGFPTDVDSINYGSEALASVYNAKALNKYTDNFYPSKPILGEDLIKMLYVYVKDSGVLSSQSVNLNEISWNKCVDDGICGDSKLIKNRTSLITHNDFISILVNKITLNGQNIRKFDTLKMNKLDWTDEAIKLFELGVYSSINGNIGLEEFVTNMEAVVIMNNVKKLLKKGE